MGRAADRPQLGPLADRRFYLVGIKGTGMAALAEILNDSGAHVTGSDVAEVFYTDALLEQAHIDYFRGFAVSNLEQAGEIDAVIHSAAYDPATHPELVAAAERGLPLLTYTQALGSISERQPSVGITGVHGKTTTAALVSCIVQATGLPGTVLAGSALPDVGGRATLVQGGEFFVAETCEYRRHFLDFSPRVIVVTSVEPDHLDYFRDAADVEDAFVEYGRLLPTGGVLIYCADDKGAVSVAERLSGERDDLALVPYGTTADGPYRVGDVARAPGLLSFTVGDRRLELHVPGDHNMLNTAAAIAVADQLLEWSGVSPSGDDDSPQSRTAAAIAAFHGTRRRAEVVGEAAGVLVLDDYGHHPTAIARTLEGFRSFYPNRRIVLSFMPHTYSRTLALLDETADALTRADVLILHDIYASARERNPGNVDGRVLADAVRSRSMDVRYAPAVDDALSPILDLLKTGDLFVTMGAGNNWTLGSAVLERLRATTGRDGL